MFGYLWRTFFADRITRAVQARSAADLDQKIASAMDETKAAIEALRSELREARAYSLTQRLDVLKQLDDRLDNLRRDAFYKPVHGIAPTADGRYMAYSTCSAADMKHPEYVEFCRKAMLPPVFHRKVWEWAFVTHHLLQRGVIAAGKRGLVFGVGTESLPAYFASLGAQILATDAPLEIGVSQGWQASDQFVDSVERLWRDYGIDRETFMQHVSYETCDMTDIPAHLNDFDFCWSSCCFEHLGSLEAGMDFVVNSVEHTLKPGGIAVHTTEFNLSSNDETILDGHTVIYRKQDIEALIQRLRDRGHEVSGLRVAPDADPLDYYVDAPPYSDPHLKLRLGQYNATSVGLVIRRGPLG